MNPGVAGIERMAANMTEGRRETGHDVVALGRHAKAAQAPARASAIAPSALAVQKIESPFAIWVIVPPAVDDDCAPLPRDNLNSSPCRHDLRPAPGVRSLDVGTPGDVWDRRRVCYQMTGGDAKVERLDPILAALGPTIGAAHPARSGSPAPAEDSDDPSGADHFVEMAHDGAEHGLMITCGQPGNTLRRANAGREQRRVNADTALCTWSFDQTTASRLGSPELHARCGCALGSGEGRLALESGGQEERRP